MNEFNILIANWFEDRLEIQQPYRLDPDARIVNIHNFNNNLGESERRRHQLPDIHGNPQASGHDKQEAEIEHEGDHSR